MNNDFTMGDTSTNQISPAQVWPPTNLSDGVEATLTFLLTNVTDTFVIPQNALLVELHTTPPTSARVAYNKTVNPGGSVTVDLLIYNIQNGSFTAGSPFQMPDTFYPSGAGTILVSAAPSNVTSPSSVTQELLSVCRRYNIISSQLR